MATRRKQVVEQQEPVKNLNHYDLEAFRKMKAEIVEAANREIADKLTQIRGLMDEIKFIATSADVEYNFDDVIGHGRFISRDWNSSSESCY